MHDALSVSFDGKGHAACLDWRQFVSLDGAIGKNPAVGDL